jgi:hypothetical protein
MLRPPEHACDAVGDLAHGPRNAAADIDRMADRRVLLRREHASLRDVVDAHEVALLQPVLEDQRRIAVQQRDAKIASTPVYGFDSACRGRTR